MRLATIASIAVLAASTAALAQVASRPVEEKAAQANTATPAKNGEGDNAVTAEAPGNGAANAAADQAPAAAATPVAAPTPRRR